MYASYVFIDDSVHPYVWFYMYCMFICMPSKNKSTAYGVCRHAYDQMHVDIMYICYIGTYVHTDTYLPTYIYPYIDTESQRDAENWSRLVGFGVNRIKYVKLGLPAHQYILDA